MSDIEFIAVSKEYKNHVIALHNISFSVNGGAFEL